MEVFTMKNIIIIQHTQSEHHLSGMVGSWTNWDLTETGIRQAENIGRNLIEEIGSKNYKMYSSDLLRTKHTAEIIAKYLDSKPIYSKVLREHNLGEAVGKSSKWLRANMSPVKTYTDKMFPSAEAMEDLYKRLKPFFDEIKNSDDENIIIISHGGTISMLSILWLGLDIEMLDKCVLFGKAGGVSFFSTFESKYVINRFSDMSYIR